MEEKTDARTFSKNRQMDNSSHNSEKETSTWKKPTMGVKLAYSLPYFAIMAVSAPISIELKIFYTDTVLVPVGLLSLAIAIAMAVDAITDPIMGWITDHTQSRWGRRKLWIALGLPLGMLTLWLMFTPPTSLSADGGAVLWAGVTFGLYYFFMTIWNVPYGALGLELTPDYDDRTSLFGIRTIIGGIGFVCALGVIYYLKSQDVFSDDRQMLSTSTAALGLLAILSFVIMFFVVKEQPEFSSKQRLPLIPGIRRAMRNRPFRILLIGYIIGMVPSTVPILLMPYFAKYQIGADDSFRSLVSIFYISACVVAIPLCILASRRYNKRTVWLVAVAFGMVTSFFMFPLGRGQTTLMLILEIGKGLSTGCIAILLPAMLADVVDYDEFRTGRRREAQFSAFIHLVPKILAIVGATIPLAILGATGYDPSVAVLSDQSTLTIRILYALSPIPFYFMILILVYRYPISRKIHEAIREGIQRHQRGESAVDPITNQMSLPLGGQTDDDETGWFLDNFSLKELQHVKEKGADGLIGKVLAPVMWATLVLAGSIGAIVWLLLDSMSRSQADQLRQGIAALVVVVAGMALSYGLFHVMRVSAAAKMKAEPVDSQTINQHIEATQLMDGNQGDLAPKN